MAIGVHKYMIMMRTFFRGLSSRRLHQINKVIGVHIFAFGILSIVGRLLIHFNIHRVEWLFTWNIREDVGMSAVTATLLVLMSFMFYLNDIRLNRHDEEKKGV